MPRGFKGIREAAAEIEARRAAGGPRALWFKLPKSGDEAVVRFLEEGDDVAFARVHEVQVDGRQYPDDVICLDQDREDNPCPGCEHDLKTKFKGWVNLIWRDAPVFKRDKEGKLVKVDGEPLVIDHKDQVAVWSSGIRAFEELDEADSEWGGLRSRDFKIKRKGTGLDTKYVITPVKDSEGNVTSTPLSDADKELEKEKYDTNEFSKPPSYEDFLKKISGGGGSSGGSGGSGGDSKPPNPFLDKRS